VLKTFYLKLIDRNPPETVAMVGQLATTMVFLACCKRVGSVDTGKPVGEAGAALRRAGAGPTG